MDRVVRFACMALLAMHAVVTTPSRAQTSEEVEADIARICTPQPPTYRIPAACRVTRFGIFEPGYAIARKSQNDEKALRLHFSMQYALFIKDCLSAYRAAPATSRPEAARQARECLRDFESNRHDIFLMYSGEFDFYWTTRPSGPVVNRISNPGGHYRQYRDPTGRWRWWDIGIEHRSDGQTTDPFARITDPTSPNFGRYQAQVEAERGNHAYLDSLSQDTNYLAVEVYHQLDGHTGLATRLKPAYFATNVVAIGGPAGVQSVRMEDYDRLRFTLTYRLGDEHPDERSKEKRVQVEWTLGDQGLATDSINLNLFLPGSFGGWNIPFFARLHAGPLNTLSDFARSQTSFGVGLFLLE